MVTSEDWVPHAPVTPSSSAVYASQFSRGGRRLWLLVNRGEELEQVELELPCESGGGTWADIYHGEVKDQVGVSQGSTLLGSGHLQ